MITSRQILFAFAITLVAASAAGAQTVTPNTGQSADQMAADQQECAAQATSSSGYNPAAPPAPAQPSGGRVRGAAKGAALGAAGAQMRGNNNGGEAWDRASDDAKQEYRQENAKDAAKVGAVAGGIRQRQDRRDTTSANANAASAYDQAYRSCLAGRGYTVK